MHGPMDNDQQVPMGNKSAFHIFHAELALDSTIYVGRAPLASPPGKLWGTYCLLGKRAQVLRQSVRLLRMHSTRRGDVYVELLRGSPLGWGCKPSHD